MSNQNLKFIAEQLNNLSCKECTKGWLKKHNRLTDPIEDIQNCFNSNLISLNLKDRLIREVKELVEIIN